MLSLGAFLANVGTRSCRPTSFSEIIGRIDPSILSRANHRLKNDLAENENVTNALDEILKTVPPDSGALSPGDTLNIFRMLNKTLTADFRSIKLKLTDHYNFPILKKAAQASLPYYKAGEIIDMLRTILSLNVPLENDLSIQMLSTLRTHTYNMSLSEIMLLDSFLRINGVEKTHLAQALQQDIVKRFNLQTCRTKVNFSYFDHMRRMIRFVHLNWRYIDREALVNMSRNASEQKVDINTAEEAMKMVMELSRSPDGCKYFKAILEKAFDVWHTSDISVEMIEKVLLILVQWKSRIDSDLFNDKRFVEKCAEKAMESGDYAVCFSIQVKFNQLKLVSRHFIDFLSDHMIDMDFTDENALYRIVTYCKACNLSGYMPSDSVINRMGMFPFEKYLDENMNWPMFACQLHCLGIYRQPLIDVILANEKSLRAKFEAYFDTLKNIQTISIENATYNSNSNRKLSADLLDIIGSNKLCESVRVGTNLMIPFLIKVDRTSRCLLPFDKANNRPLAYPKREALIAILSEPDTSEVAAFNLLCSSLDERRMSVIVLIHGWHTLPLSKQVEHLFTAIGSILKDKQRIVKTPSYIVIK